MMQWIRNPVFLLLAAIAVSISSCSPILYTAVGQNVSLFHEKGEVELGAGLGLTENTSGLNAQGSVAVGNSTMIMGSLYAFKNTANAALVPLSAGTGSGTYFELGAGKFRYKPETRICSEIVLGTGFGSINNSSGNEFVDVNYFKPFIQPTMGISSTHFEAAVTPRIGLVSYTSKSSSLTDPSVQNALDAYYADKKTSFVFEPGITLGAGLERVKIRLQYTYTTLQYQTLSANYNGSFNYFKPVNQHFFSLGLTVIL